MPQHLTRRPAERDRPRIVVVLCPRLVCGGVRRSEAAADVLRPDIVLPSAVRWVRRRLTLVRATLVIAVSLLADLFGGDARLGAVRAALGTDHALVTLRARAAPGLSALPRPLGFGPHVRPPRAPRPRSQHDRGADPQPSSG